MPWSHSVTGYAPGVGPRGGNLAVQSSATGTLTTESLRLANIFNSNAKQMQFALPAYRDALITVNGGSVKGLQFAVPNVITRFGPVTGTAISGTTVTVTIATGHNIQNGEGVTIRQVLGSTEINGVYAGSRVRRLTDTTFTISGIASITAFSTSANSIVEVTRPFASIALTDFVPATQLFTTAAAHGLAPGDKIFASQITGLTFTGPTWQNRQITVASTPSTTTFRIVENSAVTGTSSGGVIIPVRTVNNWGSIRVLQTRQIGLTTAVTAANPAVYTSGSVHGLAIGDRVSVTGVLGTAVTALNTTAVVRTVPSTTTFTLEDEAGLPISGVGSTATINTGYVTVTNPTQLSTLNEVLNWNVSIFHNPAKDGPGTGPFNL
jgi:hypothetical protein